MNPCQTGPAGYVRPAGFQRSGLMLIGRLLAAALLLVGTFASQAHDPGLSSAKLVLQYGLLRATLIFAPADVEAISSGEKMSDAQLQSLAAQSLEIRFDGEKAAPTEAHARLLENKDVEFQLLFRAPSAASLGIRSTLLDRLPFGHRQYFAVVGANGVTLAEKLLNGANHDVEVRLGESVAGTPSPSHPFSEFLGMGVKHILTGYDHLLFSFHGIPERHLYKSDPTGCNCLRVSSCCDMASPAHATCYRAQCFKTVAGFVQRAGIPPEKYSVSFQSRLGNDPWLKPYTDFELQILPKRGVKKLLVICPAFVSDCLETIEEIGQRGRDTFLQAGGKEFALIPCMNEHPQWIETLKNMSDRFLQGTA